MWHVSRWNVCMDSCLFVPPPYTHTHTRTLCPAHFTSVTPAFPFHSSKMHEYILNGRCRECRSYLQRWHLTKMAFYLCAIIDGFACFMRVRATLCWIFYQGGFSGHEKCLTGHLRCTNNLFWCKSQVAGSFGSCRYVVSWYRLLGHLRVAYYIFFLFISTYILLHASVHSEFD